MSLLVTALADELPSMRASDDAADCLAYARDLWPRHHLEIRGGRATGHQPSAIAWPATTEEVARLVRWAHARGVPIVPFGAGSGVCGGVLPSDDVLVVDVKRMGRVRAIDQHAPLVDAEAGCMGLPLERALEDAGFTLGHFPSSILCSTVGGWVAARSAGQCSGAYGKIEDMTVALECVSGLGDVFELRRRCSRPDSVPLIVGSEGTMAIVTSAKLRLHPAPRERAFGACSFPTTRLGWEALRQLFQSGLRPAVARLYDPFDAMLARRGGSRDRAPSRGAAPGLGGVALRALVRRPAVLNALLHSRIGATFLGGALLVLVFEGDGEAPRRGLDEARRMLASLRGSWEGEDPARRWMEHRYSVSYRQAPVFANGAFVDTMEVAAPWSRLGDVYEAVWRALGEHVFVMAHFSHAYPDGCCIYFSFAGAADPSLTRGGDWDLACETTYNRAWRAALAAAVGAGGTLAHHHGVGRSKAPRLAAELGDGVGIVRALMRAFDPAGILNPGNLVGDASDAVTAPASADEESSAFELDRDSLLAHAPGTMKVSDIEARLQHSALTLDARFPAAATLADWLAEGAPGTRDRWLDPADQLVAGLEATVTGERRLRLRPAPRRAVGPDLTALLVGGRGQFGRIDGAWMRVHTRDGSRPSTAPFRHERDPAPSEAETALIDAIDRALRS